MANFLPFLSGLAGGVSDSYGKIAEEDRKNKVANNKLVADSLQKRLETDDTLTPDEQTHLLDQYLDLHGVDKKHKQAIIGASGYFRNKLSEDNRQQATGAAQTRMSQAPAQLDDAAPDASGGIGDLPTQGRSGGAQSAMAPPIPAFKPQSAGDINLPQQIRKTTGLVAATADAQADAKFDLMDREDEYKNRKAAEIDAGVKSGKYTDEDAARRYEILGVKPLAQRGGGGAATYLPAPMNGKDLAERMTAEGKPAGDISAIDPAGLYRVSLDPTKTKIAGVFKMVPNTYQGKAATGSNFISQFPKDQLGNPTDPNMIYYPVLARTGGAPTGIMPETLINTESVRNNFKTVTQPDGSTVLVQVTETGQNIKTPQGAAPGASATPATPLPTPPTSLDNNGAGAPALAAPPAAVPAAPKPKRGATATPTSPLPTAGVHGGGIVVGGRPMTPEQKQKTEQQADLLNNTIGVIKDLKSQIPTLKSMISTGKIAIQVDPNQGVIKGIINRSMPLTEAEKNVATNWQLLTEGVLQMRIPMGGAGFRGPEGLAAIESNKGILTQNPDIIQRVLDGTLQEFKGQRDPMYDNRTKYGMNIKPEKEHGPAPTYKFATAPNGHKIKSLDGVNWIDAATGAPVQ